VPYFAAWVLPCVACLAIMSLHSLFHMLRSPQNAFKFAIRYYGEVLSSVTSVYINNDVVSPAASKPLYSTAGIAS